MLSANNLTFISIKQFYCNQCVRKKTNIVDEKLKEKFWELLKSEN